MPHGSDLFVRTGVLTGMTLAAFDSASAPTQLTLGVLGGDGLGQPLRAAEGRQVIVRFASVAALRPGKLTLERVARARWANRRLDVGPRSPGPANIWGAKKKFGLSSIRGWLERPRLRPQGRQRRRTP